MVRTKVVIASSRENVWRWLMEPANWKLWDYGDLQEVTPGWQAGATMKWAQGLPSKLASYKEGNALGIESEYLLSTIGLSSLGAGTTEVEIIEVPLRGASFSDSGAGRIAQLNKNLAKLKGLMESKEAFLGPLTAEEKLFIGNLPLDVYETVIREKTPGVPNLVYAAPGPDAFWRLQEQLAILRKLNIEDLKRLKESVSLVMQADVVARRGDVLAYVRGAEMYSNAARFNPFNELALMSCGVSLARAGYHGEALPWLARALEVNPGNERVKTNLEAVRADVAKGRDPGSPSGRLLGDLPEAVKSESIPAFNLIWPPAESPRPALQPKTIPAVPRKTEQAPYANILLRFVAYLIDATVLMIPSMIVLSMISPPAASSQNLDASRGLALMLLVGSWLYFAIMESSAKGATLGKMLLHLRVTDMKGDRISFARATGRFFAKALGILTLYIGFLMAFFTAKKQALHDLISGCLVVTAKKDTAELTERSLESSNAKLTPKTPGPTAPAAVPGPAERKPSLSTHERPYTGPPVRDLTQEDVIRQLRTHSMTAEEADASVQVALVITSTLDHNQINAIYNNPDQIKIKDLALKWAAHCVYHGARPRTR